MRLELLPALVLALTACSGGDAVESDSDWWSEPPEGTRWVGYDGAVVAVPDWWTTGETRCGAPVEDTVYYDSGAIYDCVDPADPETVGAVSSLAVVRDNGGYGEEELDGGCEEWFPDVCRRLFTVEGSEGIFAVTIDEEGDGDFAEIRESGRLLPGGVTTVPLATTLPYGWTPSWGAQPSAVRALTRTIERAGLEVEVETIQPSDREDAGMPADLPAGSLLDVEPMLGTPVADGSTVTVTVMGPSGQ